MLIRSCTFLLLIISSAAVFAQDRPRVFQTAEVQPAGTSAEGAAWLKRSKNKVEGRVMARVDKANTPYTIWWVVFNNPDACLAKCGPADLQADGGAAADVAIFNASGAISAASGALKRNGKPAKGGVINIDISMIGGEGAGMGSQMGPPVPPFMRDLRENNGLCAEIHLDINEHEFNGDWVQELTYPEFPQAFAIFPAVGECSGHDDSDSD